MTPIINANHGDGRFSFSQSGVEVDWKVRQQAPIDTITPVNVTNTTSSAQARDLCQKARAILGSKGANTSANLDEAHVLFQQAAKIDPDYWEPRANMAGILVIKGRLQEAYEIANKIRISSGANTLAFANASLIMASAIETSISPSADVKIKAEKYKKIVLLLNEALERAPDDVVVRAAIIRTYILLGEDKSSIEGEMQRGLDYEGFRAELVASLNQDADLKSKFVAEYPAMAVELFPVD